MVHIIEIPPYYQTKYYSTPPNPTIHPTTTAHYIALDPTPSARNLTITSDALSWGWRVYELDPTLPRMAKWWQKYDARAANSGNVWQDDLWRIWQREHGVRILEQQARRSEIDGGAAEDGAWNKALQGVLGAGKWVRRMVGARERTECELRAWEEERRKARRREKRERERERRGCGSSPNVKPSLPTPEAIPHHILQFLLQATLQ
ncbi:hypothetical protein BDW02DRAFT_602540 [Decorospora gaudefroyi]|uniref:Uncharacterized protein n=1 Tax=Decorospora gaudefroyi TaxID=184978 RepID=A0A6A5JXA4_9PLEO|nr:hypothetical protein BDW02DRAFT_602540 [Decorospora gaudefroyi]